MVSATGLSYAVFLNFGASIAIRRQGQVQSAALSCTYAPE